MHVVVRVLYARLARFDVGIYGLDCVVVVVRDGRQNGQTRQFGAQLVDGANRLVLLVQLAFRR